MRDTIASEEEHWEAVASTWSTFATKLPLKSATKLTRLLASHKPDLESSNEGIYIYHSMTCSPCNGSHFVMLDRARYWVNTLTLTLYLHEETFPHNICTNVSQCCQAKYINNHDNQPGWYTWQDVHVNVCLAVHDCSQLCTIK